MIKQQQEINYNQELIDNIYRHQIRIESKEEELKNKFDSLVFVSEDHNYTIKGKSINLTSVTTWIGRFSNKFDSSVSEIKAKVINQKSPLGKRKDSIYYKRRWDNMRIASEQMGSRVHEYAEFGYPNFADNPYCDKEKGVVEFYKNLDPKYVLISSELRIYSEDYKLAGTIDCLGINLETGNLVIFDWKTNTVPLSRRYKENKLKAPFEDLSDSSFNKYCLQLSLYKTILEKEFGCIVEDLWLIHLTDGNLINNSSKSYKYEQLFIDTAGKYYIKYKGVDVSKQLKEILDNE